MKKIAFAFVAVAALMLASCGSKTKPEQEVVQDSTKTFEQEQVEAAIMMHLDSLSANLNAKQISSIDESIKAGKITLSADEKKDKPVYLLAPNAADDVTSMGQKYAILSILNIDKAVAELYGMEDVKSYDNTIAKLAADINDPAMQKAEETEGSLQKKNDVLYKTMSDEGRVNFYWIATSAATVENLYIMSQNIDKFTAGYTDEQVSNITFRLICIIDALDRLSVYDAQIVGVAEALSPLKNLNATTVEEFKKQLEQSKSEIEASRVAFIK